MTEIDKKILARFMRFCAANNNTEDLELALRLGADPNLSDKNGYNALHVAAFSGSDQTIELFQQKKERENT